MKIVKEWERLHLKERFMKTAILKRDIPFKFGQVLNKGTKVEVTQDMGDSYLVRKIKSPYPNLEYLVDKSNLTIAK